MSSANQPVIDVRNLKHWFETKQALKGISWSVGKGRICGILGRNGAGKTTTINILNSFITPTEGECLLFGEPAHALSPETKARIGYLIEGHVQYSFFNVDQIERFYAPFYEKWDSSIYFHLIEKLDITRTQKISTMSCGQRSQVALGLILAQKPDLIIFDDYSMGLDPGYRRLFIDVIRDFAADGERTILLTSHVIQDLEDLIDDCLIYQRGKVLLDMETRQLREGFKCYRFKTPATLKDSEFDAEKLIRLERHETHTFLYGFLDPEEASARVTQVGGKAETIEQVSISLEEAFIALTGKY
jgi:ABC-2 type transport system ATP-binding protein